MSKARQRRYHGWHINSKGEVARCDATKRKCPLGGMHFKNYEDAQAYAESEMSKKFGILSGEDWDAIDEKYRIKEKEQNSIGRKGYYTEINSVSLHERIDNEKGQTEHYREERVERAKKFAEKLGEGNVLITFLIDDGRKKPQVISIRDNGVFSVYDKDTHKLVTEYAPRYFRVKSIFDKAQLKMPKSLELKIRDNEAKGYNNL